MKIGSNVLIFFAIVFATIAAFTCTWLKSQYHVKILKKCIQTEGYVERWNETDQRIRGSHDLVAYLKSVRTPNWKESRRLSELVKKVHTNALLEQIKWKFLMFGTGEGGMPHTHGPYIMVPIGNLDNIDENTLLHEKIHVYQRYHACEAIEGIESIEGIEATNTPITGFEYPELGQRANPDTSRILFGDIRPKWKQGATRLTDIEDTRDHPFELVAYASNKYKKMFYKQ